MPTLWFELFFSSLPILLSVSASCISDTFFSLRIISSPVIVRSFEAPSTHNLSNSFWYLFASLLATPWTVRYLGWCWNIVYVVACLVSIFRCNIQTEMLWLKQLPPIIQIYFMVWPRSWWRNFVCLVFTQWKHEWNRLDGSRLNLAVN